jgi:hypothetical protein
MEADSEGVGNFLAAHKSQIIALVEQAYHQAGGHYARMSPEERRQGATNDADELILDLTEGTAHLPHLPPPDVVADVLQMVSALETLLVSYVQTALATQPDLRRDLVRRMQLSTNRFRMKLSTRHLDEVQQALTPPRPDAPGGHG